MILEQEFLIEKMLIGHVIHSKNLKLILDIMLERFYHKEEFMANFWNSMLNIANLSDSKSKKSCNIKN